MRIASLSSAFTATIFALRPAPLRMRFHAVLAVFFAALPAAHSASSGIYSCKGADGNLVYSDSPCGADAQKIDVHPPPQSGRASPAAPQPPISPHAQARAEASALQCGTDDFNRWVQAQHSIPDWPIRRAKMVEFSNRCRQLVQLPDLVVPPDPPGSKSAQTRFPKDSDFSQIVSKDSPESLKVYLQSHSVAVNDRSDLDKTLLDHAAEQNKAEIARYLIGQGANVNAAQTRGPQSGTTPLHRAAAANAFEVASLLVAGGAEVNCHGPRGVTPLILAASSGSTPIAKLLLEHGADTSTLTGDRRTAMSEAEANTHPDIAKQLIAHLPGTDPATISALAARADVNGIQLLLRHDALMHDISADSKNAALRYAIVGGSNKLAEREQIIALLIASGADVDNRLNNAPNTPLMMAASPELANFLVVHGASLGAEGWFGTAANQLACAKVPDRIGMYKVLLAHHADLSSPVAKGRNGIQCALESNDQDLIRFLHSQNVPMAVHALAPAAALPVAALQRHGTIINVTTPGNLAVTSPVTCGPILTMGNWHTPPDLYVGMKDCVERDSYALAADIFALAGMESAFDSERVTDLSAGQARQVLLMTVLDGMPTEKRTRLVDTVRAMHEDHKAMADLCVRIGQIGYPSVLSEYMVMHGIRAFTGDPHAAPLKSQFDSAGTWNQLQGSYLNCP